MTTVTYSRPRKQNALLGCFWLLSWGAAVNYPDFLISAQAYSIISPYSWQDVTYRYINRTDFGHRSPRLNILVGFSRLSIQSNHQIYYSISSRFLGHSLLEVTFSIHLICNFQHSPEILEPFPLARERPFTTNLPIYHPLLAHFLSPCFCVFPPPLPMPPRCLSKSNYSVIFTTGGSLS